MEKTPKTPAPTAWTTPLAFFERGAEELVKMQAQSAVQATRAVDEAARLAKEMIEQSSRVQAEWLRLGMDLARRTTESLDPNV